jgi:hypothetical protein
MNWSCYDTTTGEIKDWRFGGSARQAALNVPAGCALLPGRYDRRSQRIDVAALAVAQAAEPWVVPPQPQAPPGAPPLEPLPAVQAAVDPRGFVVDYQPPQPAPGYEWRAENPAGLTREAQRWDWRKARLQVRRESSDLSARERLQKLYVQMVRPLVVLRRDPTNAQAIARLDQLEAAAAVLRADIIGSED